MSTTTVEAPKSTQNRDLEVQKEVRKAIPLMQWLAILKDGDNKDAKGLKLTKKFIDQLFTHAFVRKAGDDNYSFTEDALALWCEHLSEFLEEFIHACRKVHACQGRTIERGVLHPRFARDPFELIEACVATDAGREMVHAIAQHAGKAIDTD